MNLGVAPPGTLYPGGGFYPLGGSTTLLVDDTFTRTVSAGSWGTADSGCTYVETTGSNFSVNGSRGLIGLPSAGAIQTAITSGAVAKQDVDITVDLRWSSATVGAQVQSYLFAHYTDSNNHYRLRIALSTTGAMTLNVTRVVGGVAADLFTNTQAFASWSPNTSYSFRFSVTGGDTPVLQAKAWLASTAEPAAWLLNDAGDVDVSPYTTAGQYGIRHQQNAGGTNLPTISVDDYQVADTTVPPPPPPPPPPDALLHDTFLRAVAPGDWGIADDGHTYTLTTAANFSVNGNQGVISLPSAGALETTISNATAKQDNEVYVELIWAAQAIGAVTQSYLFTRYADSNNHYRLRIQNTLGGNLSINVTRVVAGVGTDLFTSFTAATLTPGTKYAVRFRATGGNTPVLQAKLWSVSAAEPTGWQINATATPDPSPITAAGSYGLRHQQNAGGTNPTSVDLMVDLFDVYDLSTSPPPPPPPTSTRLLVFGDQAGNVPRSGFVRAAAVARIGATDYRAVHVGDHQYDAAWYREIMQTNGYDAAMSPVDVNMIGVPGNHDYQNPVGGPSLTSGSPLAKWVGGTAASAWNTADKLCIPTTAAKSNGFYYKASASGTTGGTEPNWANAASPGATITDGSVTWTACWPAQDWRDYINQRKSGGVYPNYTLSREPQAAGGGYTRPAGSPEYTAMGSLYGTKYSVWQAGTNANNPHNEYGYEVLTGTDGSGTYSWLICYANTELEYGRRPGDTHTACGYGGSTATLSGSVTTGSRQYAFFQSVFALYPGIPKVVVLHWPPFHSGGEWPRVQAFCALAIQNGCRLILAGHHHNYQRYVPVDRTFSETTHAGNVLPSEACVLIINGNSGIDLNGIGGDPLYTTMFDLRGTSGTMTGISNPDSHTSTFYGFTDVQLDRTGFSITHVVGADSTGGQISYPAASNGSIFDNATYSFTGVVAPATPTITSSPSGSPISNPIRTETFSSTTAGVTYEAQFDGGAITPVTSPIAVGPVSEGSHTWRVRAVKAGVTSLWATDVWTYARQVTSGTTYTPGTPDLGYRIRVKVVASNASGSSAPVASAWSEVVTAGPELITQPVASGSLYTGNTVAVDTGDWSDPAATFTYQWQSATVSIGPWSNITGETANVYTTVTGDAGKYLRANVTASNTDGSTTTASTILGPFVVGAPINTDTPTLIAGEPFDVGSLLGTSDGSWDGSQPITFTYAWQRSDDQTGPWAYITGETNPTYQTIQTDAGSWFRAAVTAMNTAGSTVAFSDAGQVTPEQIFIVVPTSRWRYVLCNRDGTPIGNIPATSRWMEVGLSQSWGAGFTLPLSSEYALLIEPGRTRLKVYRGTNLVEFHGKIWTVTEDADDRGDGTITCVAWDQLKQLEYDHVTTTGTRNVLYKASNNETSWTILSDLIGRSNGYATASEGAEIRVGTRFGTFTAKHRKFEGGMTIWDAIMTLVNAGDKIEVWPRPVEGDIHTLTWPPDQQTPELVETITRVDVYQHAGAQSQAVFGYYAGPRNLAGITRQRDFSTVRNRAIGTGAALGTDKPRISQPQEAPTSRSRLGLMEEFADFPGIKDRGVLDDRAQGMLRSNPRPSITATPGNNAPRLFEDFNLGDTVLLVANRGSLKIHENIRVTRARIEIDDDGYDKLTEISFGTEES